MCQHLQLLTELKAVKLTGMKNLVQITHMKKDKPEYMANTSFFAMEKSEEEALSSYLLRKAAVSLSLELGPGNELQQNSWSCFFIEVSCYPVSLLRCHKTPWGFIYPSVSVAPGSVPVLWNSPE